MNPERMIVLTMLIAVMACIALGMAALLICGAWLPAAVAFAVYMYIGSALLPEFIEPDV